MSVTNSLKHLVSDVFAPEEELERKNIVDGILSKTIINPVKRSKLWELLPLPYSRYLFASK